jgi:hypothetical protein
MIRLYRNHTGQGRPVRYELVTPLVTWANGEFVAVDRRP